MQMKVKVNMKYVLLASHHSRHTSVSASDPAMKYVACTSSLPCACRRCRNSTSILHWTMNYASINEIMLILAVFSNSFAVLAGTPSLRLSHLYDT